MSKILLPCVILVIGITVYFGLFSKRISTPEAGTHSEQVLPLKAQSKNEADEEDGIKEAEEMEIERTKDMSLGYVPKYRLIEINEDLVRQRRINPNYRYNGANAFSWTERGPYADSVGPSNGNGRVSAGQVTSGRVRTVWVDLADPTNKTVWLGGIDGGLWKTNDVTADLSNWSIITDFTANIAIGSICQSPVNTNIMYFGTGEKSINIDAVRGGGVWKSIDHGVNWTLLPATISFYNVSKVLCDPANANIVYVATMGSTNTGIQRSKDGGNTWTEITPAGLNKAVTEMEISSTGRLHIVCGYRNGWFNANPSGYMFTDTAVSVNSAGWTAPTTPFTSTAYNTDLATCGDVLYALPSTSTYETSQVWKSIDGGANWAITTTTPPITGTTPLSSGQAWYNMAIGVDPTDPNKVMVGGLNTYITTNGGTTWTPNSVWVTGVAGSTNYIHADHHLIVWNNDQVMDAGDGGLFYSANDGITFADRNEGLRLKQFYSVALHPTSTNYMLAGAQDNGCHQLNGPGLTTSVEVTGGDGAFMHIDQDEPQYQFGSYVYNNYRRSTNGGATWSQVNYGNSGGFINPTDYDDAANKLYGAWSSGLYFRWDNAATSTSAATIAVAAFGGSVTHVKVSPYALNRVFFGTNTGRVVRVDNANLAAPAATNISASGMPVNNTVSCVAVGTNDDNLLASFSNYGLITNRLWVTSTGGGTSGWTNITGNFPDIPVRWAMYYPDDNTKAILGTDLGIWQTSVINGASTVWVQEAGFPTVRVDMLQYRQKDGLLAAATHGRGIFTTNIPLTTPYIRFLLNNGIKTEASTSTQSCRSYTDYTVDMNIDIAPVGNANVTLTATGSAIVGVDYEFTTNGSFTTPSNALIFGSGSAASKTITIRVYNDEEIENTEAIVFNYTVSGSTNAQAAPSSSVYTFTITDNDVPPVPLFVGNSLVGSASYAGGYIQPFRSNFSDSKSQYIYLASELAAAGINAGNINALSFNVISKSSTIAFSNLSIALKQTTNTTLASGNFETGTTPFFSGNRSTVAGTNTFAFTTAAFPWDGTSNILVEICYDNATATGSGDFVASSVTPDIKGLWNRGDNTVAGCSLTGSFNSVGTTYVRADITFNGNKGNPVDTMAVTSNTIYVGNGGLFQFFAGPNIINNLNSASANLGCVTSVVIEEGNSWQPFLFGERSQKVVEVIPTTNSSASYTIGLYFSNAELGGKLPASLRLAKTTAATMAGANNTNTQLAPIVAPVAYGTGWLFTASFTGFSKFFLVDSNATLPVSLLDFSGRLATNGIVLNWNTSSEQQSKHFELEKSNDKTSFTPLITIAAAGNSNSTLNYSYTDKQVNEYNYYRLKMVDLDGKFKYSPVVLIVNRAAQQGIHIVNNPFVSFIDVQFDKIPKQNIQAELLTVSGAKLYSQAFNASGRVRLDLSRMVISSGTYILKITADGKQYTNKVVKR